MIGDFKIVEMTGNDANGNRTAIVQCKCGTKSEARLTALKNDRFRCGGCFVRGRWAVKHGRCKTQSYQAWINMHSRCNAKSGRQHKDWGGRGIKVCERWSGERGFDNFYADMGDPPTKLHSLDRRENSGNYEPSNCRWATKKEQSRNTRRNVLLSLDGVTKTLTEWAEEYGIDRVRLRNRIKDLGWDLRKALTSPVEKREARNVR